MIPARSSLIQTAGLLSARYSPNRITIRFFSKKVDIGGLKVDSTLAAVVEKEIAPGTGIEPAAFWASVAEGIKEFGPRTKQILKKRDDIQEKIDKWHQERKGKPVNMAEYKPFLQSIGYLVPEGGPFQVQTANVDPEIATVSGPQLVCPIDNARFILNAANARWGSLLDAVYGTDVVSEEGGATKGSTYNPVRGAKVFEFVHKVLGDVFPLTSGGYGDVTGFQIKDGKLIVQIGSSTATLKKPEAFFGYNLNADGTPASILLKNNGLHMEIVIDKSSGVGKTHKAGIKDVVVESALSAIADCEDSVAAVDGQDKAACYKNWAGLMKGTLSAGFVKDGKTLDRGLNPDRTWTSPAGGKVTLPGRAVLLVRNVGMHLVTDAVTLPDGSPVPEHILDAYVTSFASAHDIRPATPGKFKNSRTGSSYIVRPKMHGPEEVQLACDLFTRVESHLKLPPLSIKMGIMDEERRTSVNLKEALRVASQRVAFINTGFLDRTGDEIHTSMEAGPFPTKAALRNLVWLKAYEDNNVDVGLSCGLNGKGQIGKGMWAAPDSMKAMVEQKIGHPMSGASTAWVPSPTAATLHALHYHAVDVTVRQAALKGRAPAKVEDILTVPAFPVGTKLPYDEATIKKELDSCSQGILGYVVRWIGQGIGCSKVPDLDDVSLMEDRATCRISSQLITNWLRHGIVTEEQVIASFHRMAAVVDRQNQGDAKYRKMSPSFESIEYRAALDLVMGGRQFPNGYTEFALVARRREFKGVDGPRSKL
mmetsp:Transcript_21118/g.58199  ORF Transcript_21118/g.58199 Transcript_21118/m.58199 type:complete len:762 (+) Transcript_21118:55-2340(+)